MPPEGPAGATPERVEPIQALLDGLDSSLDETGRETLEGLHRRVFEPLRRVGDRLSKLRDDALASESALRAAGRAVRVACNDLEDVGLPAVLSEELEGHLEGVLSFAHSTPRSLEIAPDGTAAARRSVPAREVVRAVLRASYPERLLDRLRLRPVFVELLQALPEAPADVLGEADHAARLLDRVDQTERHVRLVFDRLRSASVDEVREALLAGGALRRLRRRWRLRRAGARREAGLEELRTQVEALEDDVEDALRERRFAADLARRERALHEAGDAVLALLDDAAAEAAALERLAENLETGGKKVAAELVERLERGDQEGGVGRLTQLEGRIRELLGERQAALPAVDREASDLSGELDRFVDCARALSRVAADYLAERRAEENGDATEGVSAAELARPAVDARRRAVDAVVQARDSLQEAGEILHHGMEAARGELMAGEHPQGAEVAGLLREAFRNAANRLRETAAHFEGSLTSAGTDVRDTPEEILAVVRDRARETAGSAAGAAGAWARAVERGEALGSRWLRALRRSWTVARRIGRAWLGTAPETAAPDVEAGTPPEEGGWEEPVELPRLYRWLFRPEALDDPKLLVGRDEELDRLRALEEAWRAGEAVTAALLGAPGSGKTSVLDCAAAGFSAGTRVRRGRVDRRLSGAGEALAWMARFFGLDEAAGSSVDAMVEALSDRRELVLLEGGHRIFRRRVGGYGAVRALGRVVGATDGQIGWIVSFPLEPWRFLEAAGLLTRRFSSTIHLEAPGPDGLRDIVLRRHRATGCDLTWLGGEALEPDRRRRLATAGTSRTQELLATWYFEDLAEAVGPSVSAALRLWRRCLVPRDEGEVHVRPLRPNLPAMPDGLDRDLLQVTGSFVVHGDLGADDLERVLTGLDMGPHEALELLRRAEMLQEVPGLDPPPLRVDDLLHRRIVRLLRGERILQP